MVAGRMSRPSTLATTRRASAAFILRTNTSCRNWWRFSGSIADGVGQARLGVEVDHQHPRPELRQGEPERVDSGRLGDAALLVGYRHDACHGRSLSTPSPGQGQFSLSGGRREERRER